MHGLTDSIGAWDRVSIFTILSGTLKQPFSLDNGVVLQELVQVRVHPCGWMCSASNVVEAGGYTTQDDQRRLARTETQPSVPDCVVGGPRREDLDVAR